LRGESTPTYALLPEATLARLATMNPRLRVVYLLREPVDRAWSDVNMRVRKRRLAADFVTCGRFERDLLADPTQRAHADYAGNLERWGRFFPPDQIHAAFFDRLTDDPQGLLRDVCRFIGIDDGDIRMPHDVDRPRNARDNPPMPAAASRFLAELLGPYVEDQHRLFGNEHTARWLTLLRDRPISGGGEAAGLGRHASDGCGR
jgi:hypothetical protein